MASFLLVGSVVCFLFHVEGLASQHIFLPSNQRPLEWQLMSPTPIDVTFLENHILGPRTQSWTYRIDNGHEEKPRGKYFVEIFVCNKFLSGEYELSISNEGKLLKVDVQIEKEKQAFDVIRWSKIFNSNVTVSLYGVDVLQSKLVTMYYSETKSGGGFSYYGIPGPGCLDNFFFE